MSAPLSVMKLTVHDDGVGGADPTGGAGVVRRKDRFPA